MKVLLIFSPFSSSSYIPLGISYIKSFLEKNAPHILVKNLDLNNKFYQDLDKEEFLNPLLSLCQICPNNKNSKCKGILKNQALNYWIKISFIAKINITSLKTGCFHDTEKYNRLRRLCDLFYKQIFSCVRLVLKQALQVPRQGNEAVLENALFEDALKKIIAESPDVIGFSIFSTSQLFYSLALARTLKSRINPKIIFGGACISHLDKKTLLRMFKFIDFIIYKEGEAGMLSLLNNLGEGGFDEVPNLVYRKENKIVENKESIVCSVDQIPFPDFSDYDLNRYFTSQQVLSTLFSRGCEWGACTFCAHHKTYSKPYRTRSISNLILELRRYQKKGVKHLCFADESISAKDLDIISKTLLKKKINMNYGVMARPTKDFTDKVLQRMYKSGFRIIIWGVESFNQRILNLMNKGTQAKEIVNILKTSYKAGLSNLVYLIHGFPTQTEEEILKDTKILKKNSKYFYRVASHDFWLEEDTYIFRNPEKFELINFRREPLLERKGLKLFSPNISFINKNKIDWKRLSKLIPKSPEKDKYTNKFNDGGFLFSLEHMLLHCGINRRGT